MLLAAQYNLVAASSLILGGRGRLLGYSLRESAETPAAAGVSFYDGTTTAGRLFHTVAIASSGVTNGWFGPQGIKFDQGLFVGAYTGTLIGNVYFVAEELLGSDLIQQSNNADYGLRPRITIDDIENWIRSFMYAG